MYNSNFSNFLAKKKKSVINFIFTNSYCKTKITSIRMLCTKSFHAHLCLSFSKISKALKTAFQFCHRNVTSDKFKHDTSSLWQVPDGWSPPHFLCPHFATNDLDTLLSTCVEEGVRPETVCVAVVWLCTLKNWPRYSPFWKGNWFWYVEIKREESECFPADIGLVCSQRKQYRVWKDVSQMFGHKVFSHVDKKLT